MCVFIPLPLQKNRFLSHQHRFSIKNTLEAVIKKMFIRKKYVYVKKS